MSDIPAAEIWRPLDRFPGYEASSHGRVRRAGLIHGGHGSVRVPSGVLKPRPLPMGHLQVTLSVGNKRTTALVHRLVADAFLDPPAPGQDCVCHRDDDPSNNRPSNLFWGTRADNSADMVAKGRQRRGSGVASSKLTAEKVAQIREGAAAGVTQRALADRFSVSQSTVALIISRRTWRDVP